MTDKHIEAKQISLYTPRIKGRKLTPRQIKYLLLKIKKQDRHILKAKITPADEVSRGHAKG